MCNLIARFWDVNAGKITIGGTDVRDFKLDSLMKNISMVFQSVYLFADTIENNIKLAARMLPMNKWLKRRKRLAAITLFLPCRMAMTP